MQTKKLLTILGPTASGKTARAVGICRALNGEIIIGDSRQVYRGMDIGTGKDIQEYREIKYHLIDICEAGEKYNLHLFLKDFYSALDKINQHRKQPVLCGGTGMYIESALSGIRLPEVPINDKLRKELEENTLEELIKRLKDLKNLHNTTDIDTKKRAIRAIEIETFYKDHPEIAELSKKDKTPQIDSVIIGIDIPRDKRRERISERLERRLKEGMVDEIEGLISNGVNPNDLIYYGLEYKYVTLYITGVLSFKEMKEKLEIAIHQFGKRQMTWFRGMEKRGFLINWLPFNMSEKEFNEKVISLMN